MSSGMAVRKVFLPLLAAVAFVFSSSPGFGAEAVDLFVATDGDDTGSGSIAQPFRTLRRARDEIRALKRAAAKADPAGASPLGEIIVNIRGGEYVFEETLQFYSADDSGTAAAPITWQAYNGEKVLLSGGVKIPASQAVKVADSAILDRVLDKQAAAKLMSLNLSEYLTEIPPPTGTDSEGDIRTDLPWLYIDGKPLARSRWPNDERNEGYLRMADVQFPNGETAAFRFVVDGATRMSRWSPRATDDLYLYGFFKWDWSDAILKVAEIDAENGLVSTAEGYSNVPEDGGRFFFFNLLEEIDVPGEFYVDRSNRTVYFYPPCDMADAEIYLSRLDEAMFGLWECEYLTFRGLTMAYTRDRALNTGNSNHIVVDGCTFAHTGSTAVSLGGTATDCAVRNCHIYDTAGGIYIWNGDLRPALKPLGNVIENNRIHNNSRIHKCHLAPVYASSVGVVIRNNKIYDSPHTAIDIWYSNDGLIEYNEIHDVGWDASDMGAIYYGRDPSIMGIRIEHNYFHDIGNTYGGYGQQAIFCDDGASMPYIYGNIFYRACNPDADYGYPVKAHGSQFGLIKNNLFIDAPKAAYFQPWCVDWGKTPQRQDRWLLWSYDLENRYGGDDTWKKLTEDIDFFGAAWKEHYKGTQWEPVWDYLTPEGREDARRILDSGGTEALLDYVYNNAPADTNRIEGNVGIDLSSLADGEMFSGNGTGSNNLLSDGKLPSGNPMFVDSGRDFTLTDEGLATIRQTIPDFENIPADSIGIKEYTTQDGKSRLPGGREPSAYGASITGNPVAGESVTAHWSYTDPEGVLQGASVVTWFIADSQGGAFSRIPPGHHVQLTLDPAWVGKYVRFEVVPWNRNMLYGKAIQSIAVPVGEPSNDPTPGDDDDPKPDDPKPDDPSKPDNPKDDDRSRNGSGGCSAGGTLVSLFAVLPLLRKRFQA